MEGEAVQEKDSEVHFRDVALEESWAAMGRSQWDIRQTGVELRRKAWTRERNQGPSPFRNWSKARKSVGMTRGSRAR